MGFSVFCNLCGLTHHDLKNKHLFEPPFNLAWDHQKNIDAFGEFREKIKSINTKWMTKMCIITEEGGMISPASVGDSYNDTADTKKGEFVVVYHDEKSANAILAHLSCYKKVKKIAGKENLFDVYKNFIPGFSTKHMSKIFGKRVHHWGQDPTIRYKTFRLENEDLSKDSKVPQRIYKIIKGLKLRPSPPKSATMFAKNTVKIGNDGKKWVVAVNKNGVKRWKRKK